MTRAKAPRYPWKRHADGDPEVFQPDCNGWGMSWNPDDGRFYVEEQKTQVVRATFKDLRNAVAWARGHKAP